MKRFRAALYALLLVLCASLASATELVHFDLGQDGAATLVIQEMPDGRKSYILIDTGHGSTRADRGAGKVRAWLNKYDVRSLDAVIVTHIDADHGAGVVSLVEELAPKPLKNGDLSVDARGPPIRIGQLVWPGIIRGTPNGQPQEKAFWSTALKHAAALNIPVFTPETGAGAQLESFAIDVARMSADNARDSNDTS